MSNVHIINHTHWDREWFLTHEYTTAWIPALIDSLGELAEDNPQYEFLFDGQTLVMEDLLSARPEYRGVVQDLVKNGTLSVGPLYSQPDWRMVSGELHMRNLAYGVADAQSLGGRPEVAWLVDTFGHISQAPQILALAGVRSGFVWRGVPQMTPVFTWQGADGTRLPAVDLFGGYRNLYGITKTAEIAVDRLVAEVDKLAPVYDGRPIPLFDGYDLDTEPEDPARHYAALDVPDSIPLVASSPERYIDEVCEHLDDAPVIEGELISGKFGATFPGSLSVRSALKVLHHDAEIALHRRAEPLAALAASHGRAYDAAGYEQRSRELLQNGVHDCLCGVSIDQVHERMERSYRRILSWAASDEQRSLEQILGGFEAGTYAVCTHAMPTRSVIRAADRVYSVAASGIGVGQLATSERVDRIDEVVDSFEWSSESYEARVDADGLWVSGMGRLGRLVVRRDHGDTYSSEPGEVLGEVASAGRVVHVDQSPLDATVRLEAQLSVEGIEVVATTTVRFGNGPLIELEIDLDSTGTAFRVEAEFETGVVTDTAVASMPFDLVERPHDDFDLLGHDVDPSLAAILMGQRESGSVTEFPFHDFVALTDGSVTRAVLARGIRSYRTTGQGVISVALRRSVEWLALTDLELRSGDAGPAMYVPGARDERTITHHLAFFVGERTIEASGLIPANEAFQNPPMIVKVEGPRNGGATAWHVATVDLPMTSLAVVGGACVARFYQPFDTERVLDLPLKRCAPFGGELAASDRVGPKEIVSAAIDCEPPVSPSSSGPASDRRVSILNQRSVRVGPNRSRPAEVELEKMRTRIAELASRLDETNVAAESADGPDRYRLVHRSSVEERELLELQLSLLLNERRAGTDDEVSIPDDPDPEIVDLGWRLNELRVKRRIYDYVVQSLAGR